MSEGKCTKVCSKCKNELLVSEFYKHTRSRDGLKSQCKACHGAGNTAWRRKNPERNKANKRCWARTPKARENRRKLYAKDPDKYRRRCRSWREKNLEQNRERSRVWKAANPQRVKASNAANNHNVRAHQYGAPGTITLQNVLWLYDYYGNKCVDCGTSEDLTLDHVKPLTHGGTNWPANLQVVCMSCNHKRFHD